jgi:hypothetical protein
LPGSIRGGPTPKLGCNGTHNVRAQCTFRSTFLGLVPHAHAVGPYRRGSYPLESGLPLRPDIPRVETPPFCSRGRCAARSARSDPAPRRTPSRRRESARAGGGMPGAQRSGHPWHIAERVRPRRALWAPQYCRTGGAAPRAYRPPERLGLRVIRVTCRVARSRVCQTRARCR